MANPSPSELDMPRKLPMHVRRERTRHDKFAYYFRPEQGGKRIRLPDYGSDDFNEAYRACMAGTPVPSRSSPVRSGSLRWALNEYMLSRHFLDLSEQTQNNRARIFRKMIEKSGDTPIRNFRQRDIRAAVEERSRRGAGTPANSFLKAVKPFFAYCVDREWLAVDPTAGVKRVRVKSDGYHAWSIEEVARFVKRHPRGTTAYLALAILLYTGMRRGEVYQIGRQHIQNGRLDFTPGKTEHSSGVRVTIPVLPGLQAALDTVPADRLTFIVSGKGQPFKSAASFGNWFAERCIEAGVPGRAHGLRKAGATIAANNGATAHQLMAVYGWTKLATAEIYTRAADRARLGAEGAAKIDIAI